MQAPRSPSRARPSVGSSPQANEDSSPGRKRPKHHQEVVTLDVSAAAQLLAGLRHHLQSAATAARTEEAQRHATQELLRKTRAELAGAGSERSGAGAGSERASLVTAAHAKLQSVLPSWLLRDAPEPEVEDPRIKELETKVEELRKIALEAKQESEELIVKEDEHSRLLGLAQSQVDQQAAAVLRSGEEATALRAKVSKVSAELGDLRDKLKEFQGNNVNLAKSCKVLQEVVSEQKGKISSLDTELGGTKARLSEAEKSVSQERNLCKGLQKVAKARGNALAEVEGALQAEVEQRQKLARVLNEMDHPPPPMPAAKEMAPKDMARAPHSEPSPAAVSPPKDAPNPRSLLAMREVSPSSDAPPPRNYAMMRAPEQVSPPSDAPPSRNYAMMRAEVSPSDDAPEPKETSPTQPSLPAPPPKAPPSKLFERKTAPAKPRVPPPPGRVQATGGGSGQSTLHSPTPSLAPPMSNLVPASTSQLVPPTTSTLASPPTKNLVPPTLVPPTSTLDSPPKQTLASPATSTLVPPTSPPSASPPQLSARSLVTSPPPRNYAMMRAVTREVDNVSAMSAACSFSRAAEQALASPPTSTLSPPPTSTLASPPKQTLASPKQSLVPPTATSPPPVNDPMAASNPIPKKSPEPEKKSPAVRLDASIDNPTAAFGTSLKNFPVKTSPDARLEESGQSPKKSPTEEGIEGLEASDICDDDSGQLSEKKLRRSSGSSVGPLGLEGSGLWDNNPAQLSVIMEAGESQQSIVMEGGGGGGGGCSRSRRTVGGRGRFRSGGRRWRTRWRSTRRLRSFPRMERAWGRNSGGRSRRRRPWKPTTARWIRGAWGVWRLWGKAASRLGRSTPPKTPRRKSKTTRWTCRTTRRPPPTRFPPPLPRSPTERSPPAPTAHVSPRRPPLPRTPRALAPPASPPLSALRRVPRAFRRWSTLLWRRWRAKRWGRTRWRVGRRGGRREEVDRPAGPSPAFRANRRGPSPQTTRPGQRALARAGGAGRGQRSGLRRDPGPGAEGPDAGGQSEPEGVLEGDGATAERGGEVMRAGVAGGGQRSAGRSSVRAGAQRGGAGPHAGGKHPGAVGGRGGGQ